ncbi:hypothetical protein D1831_08650 [Lactiplantibacillus garii]|uniref:Thioredoxin-like fold domain-containing protein n=1 Tax=Lactiplantibacillus garii TaxID=2306423 RepID=A0A3R8J6H6_9LACO|nr:thioredoxin domain-containing protein [Lactiplantibacillus garii]RRK10221.1 hypothetical protein D1831_08650 [Lactiplantibacillus garii]
MATYQVDTRAATTLNLGVANAPHTLTAFFNLVCPDTLQWWANNHAVITDAVAAGQLAVHLKFWNKPKEALANGNVAHRYVDYAHPQAALAFVTTIFDHQDDLRELSSGDVPQYLETHYQVKPYGNAASVQAAVDQDVVTNGVLTVPTLILDDQKYTGDSLPLLKPALA